MSTPKKEMNPTFELKQVKHSFTSEEFSDMGKKLADRHAKLTNVILEEKQISKRYKATRAELEAQIASISTDVQNGFEMREESCRVLLFPKERKKRYWLQGDDPKKTPHVLEEEMSEDDFQQELIDVPMKFDQVEKIELFPATEKDYATMTVATAKSNWYAVTSANIEGSGQLAEVMNSKTPGAKKRWDAITRAAKRYQQWLNKTLGKEAAKGFAQPLENALAPHQERVE